MLGSHMVSVHYVVTAEQGLIEPERDAMGDDEYHPLSRKGSNLTEAGGIGYTVVDSIDTMLLMGLHDEYTRAREWVATKMTFERDAQFNTFEVSSITRLTILCHRVMFMRFHADNHPGARRPAVSIYSHRRPTVSGESSGTWRPHYARV